MTWVSIGDILLWLASAACVAGAVVSAVSSLWIPFVISLAAMLGFLGVWLFQWLPRYRMLQHKRFSAFGIDVYVYEGSGAVIEKAFRGEVMTAARAISMMTGTDYLGLLGSWNHTAVFFVPDIDEKKYPTIPYKTITGLSWDSSRLVQLLPGQSLDSSALKHELCHLPIVQSQFGDQTEVAIETYLRKVGV